jgi:predicted dehydrogenase
MPVRVAAIGVSHWHSIYDPAYLRQLHKMADVEIVGLHDPDEKVAAHRAAEVGHPPVFTDYRRMLDDTRPDFVLALGRHDAMAETAHHLLDRGLPFLMEKPMGLDAKQVRGVVEKAEKAGGFAAAPMPQRYSVFAREAQQMKAEGRFGPLSHLYIRMNRFSSARYPAWNSAWMLDPATAGGGCLRNLGAHGFDMFLWLTGENATVTAAQISHRAEGRAIEDFASVLLRSESGVLGTIEVGYTFPRKTTEGASAASPTDKLLDGADGEWKIAGRDALIAAKDGVLRIVTRDGETTRSSAPAGNPSFKVIEDAIGCWRRGAAPPASARDCYRSVALTDQAYRLAWDPQPGA